MWIFYSCPRDIKQQMAAIELNNRNWRWHKKMQMWLTKDDVMVPQSLGPTHERGYYIVWDTANWRKERVRDEFSLWKEHKCWKFPFAHAFDSEKWCCTMPILIRLLPLSCRA